MTSFAKRLGSLPLRNRGASKYAPIWFSLWFGIVIMALITMGSYRMSKNIIEHRTNVRIGDHVSPRQWFMTSTEKPKGEMYYACRKPGFSDEEWIKSGFFAHDAWWQVEDDCNSIQASGLGFFYIWKPDGTAKTNREAGYE